MTTKARIYSGVKTVSSRSGTGELDSYMQKNILEHFHTPYTKINSIWIKDLFVSLDTVKLLEGNIGSILCNRYCSNIFLCQYFKAMETKAKINKWNLIKLKSFVQEGNH